MGTVAQSINVSTKGDLLQSSTAELGTVVTEKFFSSLPLNGRNFTELLTLQAGASPLNDSQGGDPVAAITPRLFTTAVSHSRGSTDSPTVAMPT